MNKKQKQNIEKHLKMLPVAIMLSIVVTIGMFLNVSAEDVDIGADVADPNCFWSNGPGSELYVPNGKTCEIDGAAIAQDDATGWTDYAIIVYPGGTLDVGINTITTFVVDGDIMNMGTINVGDGASTTFNSVLETINGGNLTIGNHTGATMTVTDDPGVGNNRITIDGTLSVGTSSIFDTPTFNYNSDSTASTTGQMEVFGFADITKGKLTVKSLKIDNAGSATPIMDIANGATIATTGYYLESSDKLALGIGYNTAAAAELRVGGTLTIPNYALDDVNVIIGGVASFSTRMIIEDTGTVTVNEENTFLTPGDPETTPSNRFWVLPDSASYGLQVLGTLSTEMFLQNSGIINLDSTSGGGAINAHDHYKQNSGLTVASGDTMTITGTANVDGDSQIDGTLIVTDCTKITNGIGESFDVTGTFATGDGVGICALNNTGNGDGLNVQGTNTSFTIADGSAMDTGTNGGITGDFTINDNAVVDANGYFVVTSGDLSVLGGANAYLDDAVDAFYVGSVNVSADATSSQNSLLTIGATNSTSILDITDIVIGEASATDIDYGIVEVSGTLDLATGISSFLINDYGELNIISTGAVKADGTDAGGGTFSVLGGILNVDGELSITGQEMDISNNNATADVVVGAAGTINSTAAGLGSNIGLDYNGGTLDIANGGEMLFDDEIDIDTTELMNIDGFMEGTDNIYIGCIGTICKVGPSGEIKVVDGPDVDPPLTPLSIITVEKSLDLLGKLNGDDGDGDIFISGAGTAVGGPGGTVIEDKDSYTYLLARDLRIYTGASIDVSNFVNCYIPGGTPSYGGSYGGQGAGGNTATFGVTKYTTAPVYPGTPNPVGMCGFTFDGNPVSYGGGAVYIEVQRNIQIDGAIIANAPGTGSDNRGAGSGGLIVINNTATHSDVAAEFTGSADIQAVGGSATGTTNSYGGGGGRIIINSILFDNPDDIEVGRPHYEYTGGIYALGGQSNNGTTDYAAAGTIALLGDDNNPDGTLIVDQGLNRTLTIGKATDLAPTGVSAADYTFDRLYAANGAYIVFNGGPPTHNPVSCYKLDGSTILSITCYPYADKPDTLHINNSQAGAQTGDEPWVGGNVVVADLDPEFSVVHRNPEDSNSVDRLWIQVATNYASFADAGSCIGCVWDAPVIGLTQNAGAAITPGTRTEDFEYAGTTDLIGGTTYYVRIAFYDNEGNIGLWSHRDMGNHYKFTVDSAYYNISNDCSNVITITQTGLPAGDPVKNSDGKRYGTGSCTFTIDTTTNTAWKVLYGMSPNGTIFSSTNGMNELANIANDGAGDAQIDTTAGTSEEEYGFNISTDGILLTTGNVETDSAPISQKYDNWTPGVSGQYVFDIEDNGNEDQILEDNTLGAITNPANYFDLIIHLNVANDTVADDYSLETWMILTDGP